MKIQKLKQKIISKSFRFESEDGTFKKHSIFIDDLFEILESEQLNSQDAQASLQYSEELDKIIEAGNNLAESAHYVQREYDGIHRLRLALAGWYKVRADEFNRNKNI